MKRAQDSAVCEHCNNELIESLITRFQSTRCPAAMTEILQLSHQRAVVLIRHYKTSYYRSESELLSDINFKMMRSVAKFDRSKGSGFTYISKIIDSSLRTSVSNQRRNWARYGELSAELENTLSAANDDTSANDDLVFKVRSRCRTSLTDAKEIDAQRWYVLSFLQGGFSSKRHVCADAAMGVYQLSHPRARELHDLSALEVRRALYDELRKPTRIIASRLFGSRCAWMIDHRSLMNSDEFTKFFYLMKNLAPYLLLLIVDPAGKANSHRRDRNPSVSRRNIDLVLHGDPDAVLLFDASISNDEDAILSDL